MASNVIDVDDPMTHASLEQERAVAIFYDFAAAFPSIEHAFLFTYFASLGWPFWLCSIIQILYASNFCDVASGGSLFPGYAIT